MYAPKALLLGAVALFFKPIALLFKPLALLLLPMAVAPAICAILPKPTAVLHCPSARFPPFLAAFLKAATLAGSVIDTPFTSNESISSMLVPAPVVVTAISPTAVILPVIGSVVVLCAVPIAEPKAVSVEVCA